LQGQQIPRVRVQRPRLSVAVTFTATLITSHAVESLMSLLICNQNRLVKGVAKMVVGKILKKDPLHGVLITKQRDLEVQKVREEGRDFNTYKHHRGEVGVEQGTFVTHHVDPPENFGPVAWKGGAHQAHLHEALFTKCILGICPHQELQAINLACTGNGGRSHERPDKQKNKKAPSEQTK